MDTFARARTVFRPRLGIEIRKPFRKRPFAFPARTGLFTAILAPLVVVACSAGAKAPVDPGTEAARVEAIADLAPDFQLELFANDNHPDGELIRLSQFRGQPVVINFWYPSCPPCRLEMPDLEATFLKHKVDGVEFIGVQLLGLDSVEDGQEFIEEFGISYAVGPDPDGSIVKDYNLIGFPTSVFVSRDQQIVRSWAGALTGEKLEELVQELLQ